MEGLALEEPFSGLSGRGIKLVQSLCDKLHYTDKGRCVEAEYIWI